MKKRPAQESGDSYAGRFPSAWLEILHFVSDRKTPKMPENTVLFIGNAFHDLRGALHIPRALSCNHGKVLINGYEAPIIGRICMDQMIVDITDLPDVKSSDIAVIIGKSGQYEITAYDLAEASGTITNELLSRLGSRLNRMIV